MTAFAALSYSESENIGDEIQSLAAAQFLPRIDRTLDRDHLHLDASGCETALIMNGWFTIGRRWPPPPAIHPLLVSFYAPPECAHVYDRRHADWFRLHQPVGCRSTAFLRELDAIGIDAYFSGCLTLCLPPAVEERGDEVCVVDCDPDLLRRLVPARVLEGACFLTHIERSDARSLRRRLGRRARRALHGHAPRLAWLLGARYRRQRHRERLARARALLARYARARLVITGRIHCFLPCLALGTPALLLSGPAEAHRFSGLAELGRAYTARDDRIAIDWDHPEPNADGHRALAARLAATCRAWVARADAPRRA